VLVEVVPSSESGAWRGEGGLNCEVIGATREGPRFVEAGRPNSRR
jgi:hypothetical protein